MHGEECGVGAEEKCPGGSSYLCEPRWPFPGRRSMTFSRGHWIPSKSKEADATKPLRWGRPAQWNPQPPVKISLDQDIENFSEHHKVCTKRRLAPPRIRAGTCRCDVGKLRELGPQDLCLREGCRLQERGHKVSVCLTLAWGPRSLNAWQTCKWRV